MAFDPAMDGTHDPQAINLDEVRTSYRSPTGQSSLTEGDLDVLQELQELHRFLHRRIMQRSTEREPKDVREDIRYLGHWMLELSENIANQLDD